MITSSLIFGQKPFSLFIAEQEKLGLNMLLKLITVVLFLISMVAAKASSFKVLPDMMKRNQLLGSLQVQAQVPKPNARTTGDIPSPTTTQKAFTSDQFNLISPLLRRQLLKGPVPPSAPNPGTRNPASTSHNKTPPSRTMPDGKVSSIP